MLKIKLLKFKEYQGRSDIKYPAWFCMDNSFLTRVDHFGKLTKNSVVSFIYIVSECTKIKRADIDINEAHASLCSLMSIDEFIEACKILNDLNLISFLSEDPVHIPHRSHSSSVDGSAQPLCAGQEGSKGQERVYELLDEYKPKKQKRERSPKLVAPSEAIPELLGIKEILESRKVTTILQQKWLRLYTPSFIGREINKADSWAIANDRNQKNWGLFFNNWLMRSAKDWPTQPVSNELQKAEPPKKSWFALQCELQEQGLPNQLAAQHSKEEP